MAARYDVYGIGNALVDLQYEVEPAFLERMGIAKGVMTLVDEARQDELMRGVGAEPVKRSSGGSAANTMIGLARFGGRAAYACRVGDDAWGRFYLEDLQSAGVRTSPDAAGAGVTGKCLVLITPDAERTMNTFLGITGDFGPDRIEEEVLRDSARLYIEGYLLFSDSGFAAARRAQELARRHGAGVALTFSDRSVVAGCRDRLGELLRVGVDLLFCNADEARAWTGAASTGEAARALFRSVPRFAVTCGAEGALIGEAGGTFRVPAFPVQPVDTNGAGDMFAGGFLYGIARGHDAAAAAVLANYGSSLVVGRFGPRLDESLADQVDRILSLRPRSGAGPRPDP